jgi:3-phosphoshikimate 1-carboxyvinyltransferase
MRKLGYVLTDINDCELLWDGTRCEAEPDAVIDTYEDHRMALSFVPARLVRPIVMNNPQVVSKSYPQYWHDLQNAGFIIEETK